MSIDAWQDLVLSTLVLVETFRKYRGKGRSSRVVMIEPHEHQKAPYLPTVSAAEDVRCDRDVQATASGTSEVIKCITAPTLCPREMSCKQTEGRKGDPAVVQCSHALPYGARALTGEVAGATTSY